MLPGWMSPDPPEPPDCEHWLYEDGVCTDCGDSDRRAFAAWAISVVKRNNEPDLTDDIPF